MYGRYGVKAQGLSEGLFQKIESLFCGNPCNKDDCL